MIRPRPAVDAMAPYDPPRGGRLGKLRLDFNESTAGPSPRVLEALRAATAEELAIYPEYGEAYAALAKHFGAGEDELLLTNGADLAIHSVVETFVEAGDAVQLHAPAYAMFRFYAQVAGARVVDVPYHEDLAFPLDEATLALEKSPRLCVIASPNNPTGTSVAEDELKSLFAGAPDTLFLLDEAYGDFLDDAPGVRLALAHDNVVTLKTFSKAYGLAGLRLGVAIGRRELIGPMKKSHSPYSVSTLGVKCLVAALSDPGHVRRYVAEVREGRAALVTLLVRRGVDAVGGDANFVIARLHAKADTILTGLRARGILVRDRRGMPLMNGCLRLGLGGTGENARLFAALEELLP